MVTLEAPWLNAPLNVKVMSALDQAFYVGGCVRNAVLGSAATDIDIATPHLPSDVIALVTEAGLKAVPTGIEHGTVTVVGGHGVVEVTTFRRDVATDGRHATVAFTDQISADAGRRDFTINALYANADGSVIDPLGTGLADLDAGRVRFIGDPDHRIAEDVLRILRFFRFSAWYAGSADGALDAHGLRACARHVGDLSRLARERVGLEMRKLLGAPEPWTALMAMSKSGVLAAVLPQADMSGVPILARLEHARTDAPDWILRLTTIAPVDLDLATALRLSRDEAREVLVSRRAVEVASREGAAAAAYRCGASAALRGVLIAVARKAMALPENLDEQIAHGAAARLPIDAADLMANGFLPGPEIGVALSKAEEAWIASAFTLSRHDALDVALAGQSRGTR